jgi:hypothetical protein
MPNDSQPRATESHEPAAYAHRSAAVHNGIEDHQTGHEHSKQALEHRPKVLSGGGQMGLPAETGRINSHAFTSNIDGVEELFN